MAIIGLGVDVVEIARIKAMIIRNGDRLAQRVLSVNEWMVWKLHRKPECFLAKRFAVKEAAAKALGTGIYNKKVTFSQLEVLNDTLGRPHLYLSGEAYALSKKLGVTQLHVTITDERQYACAVVILEN